MIIDCDACVARPRACGDCVVTHLLGPGREVGGRGTVRLDDAEVVAVGHLAAAGLLPPLRLVSAQGR